MLGTEAGHTVVAWAVNRPIGGIRILGNGDGASDIDVTTGRVEAYNAEARAHPDDDEAQRRLGARGRAKARRLIREHWPLVERLGAALYQQASLSEAEVRTMLGGDPERA